MSPSPPTSAKDLSAPQPAADELVRLYLEAQQDSEGPGMGARARILEYASRQARGQDYLTPAAQQPAFDRPSANDGHWLRRAVAGMAGIGIVGWLVWGQLSGNGADGRLQAEQEAAAGAARSVETAEDSVLTHKADQRIRAAAAAAPSASGQAGHEQDGASQASLRASADLARSREQKPCVPQAKSDASARSPHASVKAGVQHSEKADADCEPKRAANAPSPATRSDR